MTQGTENTELWAGTKSTADVNEEKAIVLYKVTEHIVFFQVFHTLCIYPYLVYFSGSRGKINLKQICRKKIQGM